MKESIDMTFLISEKRTSQIIIFLKSLKIKSKRFSAMLKANNNEIIRTFNEALTHSSENNVVNYEKLEFFGDAVLRLAASNFINKKYDFLSVGKRSALRSYLVSDEWLIKLGEKINIEQAIVRGAKSHGDENSRETIIGESTEALIGSLYKCFNSIQEVNIWLDDFWEQDSEEFLQAPYKFNAKSALQEWCQRKGYELPMYKITEVSKKHGDPKRFLCEIFIRGCKESYSFGQSHKKAEKDAAYILIEKFMAEGKN